MLLLADVHTKNPGSLAITVLLTRPSMSTLLGPFKQGTAGDCIPVQQLVLQVHGTCPAGLVPLAAKSGTNAALRLLLLLCAGC